MFCNYCGSQNPDHAFYCARCGRKIAPPVSSSEVLGVASAEPVTPAPYLPPTEQAPEMAPTTAAYKWATAYGWLFLVAGIYSSYTGLVTEVGVAIFQGLLFGLTGIAILQKTKFAGVLVWITVVLSGLGVIFRGVTPLDLLLWLMWLGLAIWYTKNKKLMESSAHSDSSNRKGQTVNGADALTLSRNAKVVIVGVCCLVAAIALIILQRLTPDHARGELARLHVPYDELSFLKAAGQGDTMVVKLFLQTGMNPQYALHMAARGGHTEIVHLLLDRGASVNNRDRTGFTPLGDAILQKDPKEVRLLLSLGADVKAAVGNEAMETCSTPLMWASFNGNAEVVRLLLASGADAKVSRNGDTPVWCALITNTGQADVIRTLLENGAVVSDREVTLARVGAKTGDDYLVLKMLEEARENAPTK